MQLAPVPAMFYTFLFQKLAPAEKNSTDMSASSAAFCISELSPNSIAKWNKYFRYICKNDYFKNRKLIGGEDCIVEIDETMCYSCTITNVCFDIVNFKNVFFYRTHVHMGSDHWVALSETFLKPVNEDCQCCEDLANED